MCMHACHNYRKKLEVMVKNQDDVFQQKHRNTGTTIRSDTPSAPTHPHRHTLSTYSTYLSYPSAAIRLTTPSIFPLNSTRRIDHQLMPGEQLVVGIYAFPPVILIYGNQNINLFVHADGSCLESG